MYTEKNVFSTVRGFLIGYSILGSSGETRE
jgi:hypothetical protein